MDESIDLKSMDVCCECLMVISFQVKRKPHEGIAYHRAPNNDYYCAHIFDKRDMTITDRVCVSLAL